MLSSRGTIPPKTVLSARGTSPPKAVLSVWGTSPPKPTLGIGENGARSPPVRRRQILQSPTGLGLVNPTRLKFVKPLPSNSVADSAKQDNKIGYAVGAAFAVLEYAIGRGDELKLPLDSCINFPLCHCSPVSCVRRICGTLSPIFSSEAIRSPNIDAGPQIYRSSVRP